MLAHADRLAALVAAIFTQLGCVPEEGERIGRYLVSANLTGHDSHGVIRVPRYVQMLAEGKVVANRKLEVVIDTDVLAVVDGGFGFGQSLAPEAVALGIAKAKRSGVGLIALRRAGHVGRVGDWAEMAAAEGLVSVHFVNAAGSVLVAPYGGAERRFSTAPFCVGVPRPGEPPIVLDFATSVVAEGKVLVAAQGGKPVPPGALITAEGELTNDPLALYGAAGPDAPPDQRTGTGAIRAMGEHKGSGLALICELLGGALTGNGCAGPGPRPFANGMLSFYVEPGRLGAGDAYTEEVARYVAFVTAARPARPGEPVLVPGDPERATAAKRRADGIPIPDKAWAGIAAAARAAGIDAARIDGVAMG